MTQTSPSGTAVLEGTIEIEFLYFDDCPSHERALELLEQAVQDEGVDARIDIRCVETEEEAEAYRFPGSPTIRVNGVDIDQDATPPVGLSCRAYRLENGRISPLPPKEKIVSAIRQAARSR